MGNTSHSQYEPDYLVTPGEVLVDYLDALEMTQVELADRTGLAKKTVNEIIKAKAPISPDSALKLERVLGRPAHFWNNLERDYQEDLARFAEMDRLQSHLNWLKQVPVHQLIKRGWINKFSGKVQQLEEVLRFFGVATPDQWQTVWEEHQVAYRQSQQFGSSALPVSAWLRQGEIAAREVPCKPFNKKVFNQVLDDARALTREKPEIFQPWLIESCSRAGVAVVFIPELPKSRVSGCTRWIGDKAVIQLSLRYKSNDHLWFTFFHEAGHILKHGRKAVFLEGNGMNSEKEEEANTFARNHLISPKEYRRFLASWDGHTLVQVNDFAEDIGIAPGIVIGRLQFDKHLPNSHGNSLKVFYKWS